MAFLSDKITDIGLPAELSLFTVPPNQVAVDTIYISTNVDLSVLSIRRTHQSKLGYLEVTNT